MERLYKAVKERFPGGGVIAFASFGHGFGRSYVKEKLAEVLSEDPEMREKIELVSTGDVFREIAKRRGFDDIGAFARFLKENPDEAVKIDTEIDRKVMKKIREAVRSGKIVLIDSNLHAWPHALEDVPSITFVIYAHPRVVGERLVKKRRKGERKYSTPHEALRAQMKRTREDIARYIRLASLVEDQELRKLYKLGALRLGRALRAYQLHFRDGLPPDRIVRIVMGNDVYVVDNSGDIRETLSQIERILTTRK